MTGYWIDKWQDEADRNIRIILEEFGNLNADKLNYSSHIKQCSIIEIMSNLIKVNHQILNPFELRQPHRKRISKFRINNLRMLLLQYSGIHSCRKGQQSESATAVFELLSNQQKILKALLLKLNETDLNCRIGALSLFRIIKLTVGESIEYLMYCQWQHITQARRILMLQ